ncbi:MAG: AAA family ATPase [Chloroflexota bacterium]|nr:AAA family ATPase [Chloroflexota bacterium]
MNQRESQLNQARAKLMQIFRYVQAFNHLQNPIKQDIQDQPWVLWFSDLPDHPCIRRGIVTDAGKVNDDTTPKPVKTQKEDVDAGGESFILKVRRPKLTDAPQPPKEIATYLQNGWQDVDGRVALDPKRLPEVNADPRLKAALQKWLAEHDRWVNAERPARHTMAIFDQLYALRAQLEREAERLELMLGDGLLDWCPEKNRVGVYHPLLLLRLQLQFNPQLPEFTLSATDSPPELYTALLQTLDIDAVGIGRCRQEFERDSVQPLGDEETSRFLQRLVYQLSPRGEFSARPVTRQEKQFPLITRNPVFFLRSRALGFNTALEAILENLPARDDLPYSLLSLTGLAADNTRQPAAGVRVSPLLSPNGEDEQILFSKPANAEQLEIARRLDRYGAVLVQGPPGTGKTHTIANLLGHLLAQGKSVLVTSHTSKALRVLREKVVGPLQPLCVSMLEDDSRKQMESAIDAITERLAFSNVDLLERDAAQLTQQRIAVIGELRRAREELKEARAGEYREVVLAGRTYSPADAARYIMHNKASQSWIPAPATPGAPLPLSQEELVTLYRTNAQVTLSDERAMAHGLPAPEKLCPPADFESLVAEHARFQDTNLEYRRNLWQTVPGAAPLEALKQIQARLTQALEPLKDSGHDARWRLAVIAAGREGGPRRQVWHDLIAKIESVDALAVQAHPSFLEYGPVLSEEDAGAHADKTFGEISAFLERGGSLKGVTLLMHREWKTFIEKARVNGQQPSSREHFIALLMLVRLRAARQDLLGRWQRQMTVLGAPPATTLGQEPERACKQYVYQIRHCLDWFVATWAPLEHELKQQGLRWETVLAETPVNLAEHGDLLRLCDTVQQRLPPLLNAEINRRMYAVNEGKLLAVSRALDLSAGAGENTEVVQRLRAAVTHRQSQAYREAFEHLVDLYGRQEALRARHALLLKLEQAAPGWAAAIRDREGVHGGREVPGDAEAAWLWRQLRAELERRGAQSLEALQDRSVQLSSMLQTITAELVEKKAWAAQVRRTTLEQRRALQGWKELIRKVGKGTGKRSPQLLAEARQLMPVCQTAVPVWIMPLSRVVQNFDPRRNRFDVVIIDEASQADIKALTALYMGQQVVVVGDDEQVTPVAVGQKLDQIDRLINEHLQNIPLAKMYDGRLSVYALAKTTFEPVCLQEHFRCVSPIIQFSNDLSYEGKIKPLRDDSRVTRRPATVAYRVNSSGVAGHVNEQEAQTIAALLVAATEQPEYQNATFGVISMVDDEQALRIDALLRKYLPATTYARHQILCGAPAHFQGDERDVIFLSMVDTPKGDGPLSLRGEDAFEYMFKKRFNVAASRARDQMWVVYSLDPDVDLKAGDIRKRLILHARNAVASARKLEEQERKVESEFERQVLKKLAQAGYRVISQWPVGAYRIDLVVEGAGKRLAVECDGDRWHPIEKLEEDMARQAILERLGWRFVRIRGSLFFRDPDQAMEPVFARLRALEIPPEGGNQAENRESQDAKALQDRIVCRAAELGREWATASGLLSKRGIHALPPASSSSSDGLSVSA